MSPLSSSGPRRRCASLGHSQSGRSAALGARVAPARRRVGAGTAILSAALALSGCGFAPTPPPSIAWSSATPTASATVTPKAAIPAPVLDVGTVVATGRLVGDSSISGDVDVRVTGKGIYEVRPLNFRSTHSGQISAALTTEIVEPGTPCISSRGLLDYGDPGQYNRHALPILKDFASGDPGILRTALIRLYDETAFEDGCAVSVLASAVLAWTLPDMRPGLALNDTGKTGGAAGEVALEDGEPLTYTVAINDLLPEVAARLSVTPDDIVYLNPGRTRYELLQLGEVLNLSRAHR